MSILIIYFLIGLVVGSFLNVVIYRLKTVESIVVGRSKCPKCKETLNALDLIPIISFVLLKGNCRYCKEKISWQYPLVEVTSALLFLLSAYLYGLSYLSALMAVALSLLLILVVLDLKDKEVPEIVSWSALVLALIGKILITPNEFGMIILGGVVFGGVIALLHLLSKGKAMGDGDIKIAATIGVLLGFPVAIVGLFLSFVLGALVGGTLIALKLKTGKDQVPFVPFMVAALIISLIWGQKLIEWYLGSFII